MIRLISTPTDAAIERLEKCEQRAQDLQETGAELTDSVKNCFRHPDVKASILIETAKKCAYCEGRMTHVHWGEVEHIYPKALFPERALEYDNLTLACAICNNAKSDYFNYIAPILHPYEDEPETHLIGLGVFIWARNGSDKGQRTIQLLKLNRDGLHEKRQECLERLDSLAGRYCREPEGPIKNTYRAQIRDEVKDSSEFALCVRSFLFAVYDFRWNEI